MFRLDKDSAGDRDKRRKESSGEADGAWAAPGDEDETLVLVERSVNPYLVLFHEPTGYRAEQIRDLRNKLIAMNPDGSAKTLVVTSAVVGEGKSISAINLAMAFAERERTPTLILEADLRQPSVEEYLHVNRGPGLSDVLLGRATLDQVLKPSGISNLTLFGSGSRVSSPAELLTGGRMDELFSRLKERFQYVIVDTPPVVPASETSVLAANADGTLLVVRLEHSTRSMTNEAKRNLEDLGGNILGVFVTEVRGRNLEGYAKYGYHGQSLITEAGEI